jgi:hypothetical protein
MQGSTVPWNQQAALQLCRLAGSFSQRSPEYHTTVVRVGNDWDKFSRSSLLQFAPAIVNSTNTAFSYNTAPDNSDTSDRAQRDHKLGLQLGIHQYSNFDHAFYGLVATHASQFTIPKIDVSVQMYNLLCLLSSTGTGMAINFISPICLNA